MRDLIRRRLHQGDADKILVPLDSEAGNVAEMSKDGKERFNPRKHPKLMRK